MSDESTAVADLAGIDREVGRAFAAWSRWRERLAADPVSVADEDPLEPFRRVTGQTTWRHLGELQVSAQDAALRDALRRWVHALLQARLGREFDAARARAAVQARGRFRGLAPRLVGWAEAWRGVVGAHNAQEADRWLEAAVECGAPLASIDRERAARRIEIARRLGLDHSTADAVPVPRASLHAASRALLAQTEDLARALLNEARHGGTAPHLFDAIHLAVARDAAEGWPPRLSPRWLEDLFGAGARGLDIVLPRMPGALGASSFARALGAFGFAFRVATGARANRFAIAREPAFVDAHRFAFIFASLPTSPDFHRVALRVGARIAGAQSRALARTALFDARFHAVRLLLSAELGAEGGVDLFEELTTRSFGIPLPAALAGAWPAPRDDESARFLALLTSLPLLRDLVDRFDSDWFANPRALPHLRAVGAAPAHDESRELDAAALVMPLARTFEEALA